MYRSTIELSNGLFSLGYQNNCQFNFCADCDICVCTHGLLSYWDIEGWKTNVFTPIGDRRRGATFGLNEYGYFVGGEVYTGCPENLVDQDISKETWRFKRILDSYEWEQMDNILGLFKKALIGFSISNFGYAGLGLTLTNNPQFDFYRFDPSQPSGSQWQPQSDFPNNYQHKGPGFALKDKGYVIASDDRMSPKELWQFDPGDNPLGTWNRMSDLPASPGGLVQASFVIDNNAYVYLDSIPDNFWMYVPEL
jgi:hypothetical protein